MKARATELAVASTTRKRVLVLAEDHWLRFRLEAELERAGSQVEALPRWRPGIWPPTVSHHLIVLDAASYADEPTQVALQKASPDARWALLLAKRERALAEPAQRRGFDFILPKPEHAAEFPPLVERLLAGCRPHVTAVPVPMQFQFLLPASAGAGKRQSSVAVMSVLVHVLVLAVALLIPLYYTDTLNMQELTATWLVAPPPPPPPPPPQGALKARRARPVFQSLTGKLIAPTAIPHVVARIVDPVDLEIESYGVPGGIPGGVPGGQIGGVLGGVLGGIPSAVPRTMPPPSVPQAPIRIGGHIRPPRQLVRVEPNYPTLAKQARIQGEVRIDAIIDANGQVVEMRVLSGHPLLAKAALEAVQQWRYEPTYLNDVPVPVVLEVTVYFRLL